MATIINCSFNPRLGEEKAILDFLDTQPNRSAVMKRALMMYMKYAQAVDDPQALLDRLEQLGRMEQEMRQLRIIVSELSESIKAGVSFSVQAAPPQDANRLQALDLMSQMDDL